MEVGVRDSCGWERLGRVGDLGSVGVAVGRVRVGIRVVGLVIGSV